MGFKKFVVALLVMIFGFGLWADSVIVEPDQGAKPIANLVSGAKSQVNLAIYQLLLAGWSDKCKKS